MGLDGVGDPDYLSRLSPSSEAPEGIEGARLKVNVGYQFGGSSFKWVDLKKLRDVACSAHHGEEVKKIDEIVNRMSASSTDGKLTFEARSRQGKTEILNAKSGRGSETTELTSEFAQATFGDLFEDVKEYALNLPSNRSDIFVDRRDVGELATRHRALLGKSAQQTEQLSTTRSELETLRRDHQSLRDEKTQLEQKEREARNEYLRATDALEAKLSSTEVQLADTKKEADDLGKVVDKLRGLLALSQSAVHGKSEKIEQLQLELQTAREQLDLKGEQILALTQDVESAKSELQETSQQYRSELRERHAEIASLKDKLSASEKKCSSRGVALVQTHIRARSLQKALTKEKQTNAALAREVEELGQANTLLKAELTANVTSARQASESHQTVVAEKDARILDLSSSLESTQSKLAAAEDKLKGRNRLVLQLAAQQAHTQKKLDAMRSNRDNAVHDLGVAKEVLAAKTAKVASQKSRIAELMAEKEELMGASQQRIVELENKVAKQGAVLSKAGSALVRLNRKYESAMSTRDQYKRELEFTKQELQSASQDVLDLTHQRDGLQVDLHNATEESQKAIKLELQLNTVLSQLEQSQATVSKLTSESGALKDKLDLAADNLKSVEIEKNALSIELEHTKARLEERSEAARQFSQARDALELELWKLEEKESTLEADLRKALETQREFREDVEKLSPAIDELKRELAEAKADKEIARRKINELEEAVRLRDEAIRTKSGEVDLLTRQVDAQGDTLLEQGKLLDELQARLAASEANASAKGDAIGRAEELEKQLHAAHHELSLRENELGSTRDRVALLEKHGADQDAELQSLRESIPVLEKESRKSSEKAEGLDRELKSAKSRIKELEAGEASNLEVIEQLGTRLVTAERDTIPGLEADLEKLRDENTKLKALEEEYEALKLKSEAQTGELSKATQEALELNAHILDFDHKLEELEKEVNELRGDLKREGQAKVEAQKSLLEVSKAHEALEAELKAVTDEREDLRVELAQKQATLEALEDKLGEANKEVAALEELREEVGKLDKAVAEATDQDQVANLFDAQNEAVSRLERARAAVTELAQAVKDTKAELARETARADAAEAELAILKAKQTGLFSIPKASSDYISRRALDLRANPTFSDFRSRLHRHEDMLAITSEGGIQASDLWKQLNQEIDKIVVRDSEIPTIKALGLENEDLPLDIKDQVSKWKGTTRTNGDRDKKMKVAAIAKREDVSPDKIWERLIAEFELKKNRQATPRKTPLLHSLRAGSSEHDLNMLKVAFLEASQSMLQTHATLSAIQSINPRSHFDDKIRTSYESGLGVPASRVHTMARGGDNTFRIPSPGENHCLKIMDIALKTYRDSIQQNGHPPKASEVLDAIAEDKALLAKFTAARIVTDRGGERSEKLDKKETRDAIASESLGNDFDIHVSDGSAKSLYNNSAGNAKDRRVLDTTIPGATPQGRGRVIRNKIAGEHKASRLQLVCAKIIQSLEEVTAAAGADIDQAVKKLPTLRISDEFRDALEQGYPPTARGGGGGGGDEDASASA